MSSSGSKRTFTESGRSNGRRERSPVDCLMGLWDNIYHFLSCQNLRMFVSGDFGFRGKVGAGIIQNGVLI
jgi:hypothetical protein